MENTLLVALSRQMALRNELDVVANNMANINTHGFRREAMQFQEYLMPVASADGFPPPDQKLSYVEDRATYHDFEKGPLETTGNPLDLASSDDVFFTVQSPDGQAERYTRNGSFQIDRKGGSSPRRPAGDGQVRADHARSAGHHHQRLGRWHRLQQGRHARATKLAIFPDPQSLVEARATACSRAARPDGPTAPLGSLRVMQGVVEGSNVKAVLEMSRMIEINRAYSSLAALIQHNDDLRKSAVERLADIPT